MLGPLQFAYGTGCGEGEGVSGGEGGVEDATLALFNLITSEWDANDSYGWVLCSAVFIRFYYQLASLIAPTAFGFEQRTYQNLGKTVFEQ